MTNPEAYRQKCIKIGLVSVTAAIIANFCPAIYFYITYGVMPPFSDLIKLWTVAAFTFGVSWFIQPTTFFSLMGVSGTYIGWVTGNCADIRCPAITMAQKVAGYEAGTPEGDVMATMGITASTFTSICIITFFAIAGGELINQLPPFIKAGFKYILPAVFGAVYTQLCTKHLKVGFLTIILAVILTYLFKTAKVPNWILNIAIILGGVLIARIDFKSKQKSA